MSDDQSKRRYRCEVIPTRKACLFTVEAESAEEARQLAEAQAGESPVLEGAKWEVRRLYQ